MTGRRLEAALLLALTLLVAPAVQAEPATGNPFEAAPGGWFWYQDPPPPREPAKAAPEPAAVRAVSAAPEKPEWRQRFDDFQTRMKESRMRFFIDPSPENAYAMAELQTAMVQRASDAADIWQRMMWGNPQFDFTQKRPVNRVGLDVHEAERRAERAALFDRLARTQVLYFFFSGDCGRCEAFAPILQGFSRATGIQVFPISLDGGTLAAFPNARADNGISRTLSVDTTPALFLADPEKAVITPVGFGVMSEMELAQRIETIASPPPDPRKSATPALPYPLSEVAQ